jgi:hypothetical protein
MTVNRSRILRAISEYRLESEFKAEDVILAADRSGLIHGEGLNSFLKSIEHEVSGLDSRKICAMKNKVFELASNMRLHGSKGGTEPGLLLLARKGELITVWMFGSGRKNQIERLKQIVASLRNIAERPDHRRELLKRRNLELLRKSASPAPKEGGAGAGILTIAALSSEPLSFYPKSVSSAIGADRF